MTAQQPNRVYITEESTEITVEELRNEVVVDEESPNNIYVTVRRGDGGLGQSGWSYGVGAPWTITVEVGG